MRRPYLCWLALFLLPALRAHAQAVPLTLAPQAKAEDVLAVFHADVDTLLQQHKDFQQFLFTHEMRESFSTLQGRHLGNESMKFDTLFIAGKPYARLIERNGKPLSKKDAAEEDRKYNEALANHNSFTPSNHFSHGVSFSLKDVQSRYTLHYVGWETVAGRRLWRIEANPPPESDADATPIPQIRIVFWVDEETKKIVRDDSTLYKENDELLVGSYDTEEYTQMEGFYCVTRLASHLVLRAGHVIDSEHLYTNYRKFNSTVRILSDPEVQQ